jgi:hypothetical protein
MYTEALGRIVHNEYRELFLRCKVVKSIIHSHVLYRLRIRGAFPPFPVLLHGIMLGKKKKFMTVITIYNYINTSKVSTVLLRGNSTSACISYQSLLPESFPLVCHLIRIVNIIRNSYR